MESKFITQQTREYLQAQAQETTQQQINQTQEAVQRIIAFLTDYQAAVRDEAATLHQKQEALNAYLSTIHVEVRDELLNIATRLNAQLSEQAVLKQAVVRSYYAIGFLTAVVIGMGVALCLVK